MKVTGYKKTRFAPTPSGFLHLGNILSFAITSVFAKETGAKILLRIDDMDRVRASKLYLQDIFDTLNFMEIPWDEGPQDIKEFETDYSQLQRMDMYNAALKQLVDNGMVFACICSRNQLQKQDPCPCFGRNIPLSTENANWRLITWNDLELSVKSRSGGIIRAALPTDMHNFVVRKKDGFPSSQLTSVIDDLFYEIDLVVRGEDLWPSTLAQHQLALSLGNNKFSGITFFHHPLLVETSGEKLSKSAGATSIKYLRENGKKPGEIYQLIASMLGIKETIVSAGQLSEVINANQI